MQWYVKVLKNYVGFSGRATRTEFWMFTLISGIISIALYGLGHVSSLFLVLYYLYALGTVLPSLAVEVRRLHDTGRSGWFILLSFIPLVGAIILLVFLCQGSREDNKFGEKRIA